MKKNLIIDTDIGCDSDDVLALAYAFKMHNMGLCNFLGITYCSILEHVPDFIRLIARQYGHNNIPVGVIKNYEEGYYDRNSDSYAGTVLKKFPITDKVEYEDAVKLMRRLLVQTDGKVTIAAIGPMPNIAQLLKSQPDDISPLNGIDLVREKVEEFALMIGDFRTGAERNAEWNIMIDINSAKCVMEMSPVPVVLTTYELGLDMITGAKMVQRDGDTQPASYSYITHGFSDGRHSWDPATILYAVRGCEPWFDITPAGVVTVDDEGYTTYVERVDGLHRYLKCKLSKEKIAEEIDSIV